jgi:hypothetical protein
MSLLITDIVQFESSDPQQYIVRCHTECSKTKVSATTFHASNQKKDAEILFSLLSKLKEDQI